MHRELLTAAANLSAAARIGAGDVADSLGDEALAVWQAVAHLPNLGAHARASATAITDDEPRIAPADARWLAVEFATAALDGTGPDEAAVGWEIFEVAAWGFAAPWVLTT